MGIRIAPSERFNFEEDPASTKRGGSERVKPSRERERETKKKRQRERQRGRHRQRKSERDAQ
eukprot:8201273-Alexandrium_andersonii.AAC.1